jgi:phosphoglycolate phosphatase-like HAD superfamily hydrolase
MEDIRKIEREAMESQKPQPGLKELMDYLSEKQIQKGICTRNFE